jgi:hypothetical protein
VNGVNSGILREAQAALDALITATPATGPVRPKLFLVPRVNSLSNAIIGFDLAALVTKLLPARRPGS